MTALASLLEQRKSSILKGWIDTILDAWDETGQKMENYAAGTWGPKGSSLLLDRNNRAWNLD